MDGTSIKIITSSIGQCGKLSRAGAHQRHLLGAPVARDVHSVLRKSSTPEIEEATRRPYYVLRVASHVIGIGPPFGGKGAKPN